MRKLLAVPSRGIKDIRSILEQKVRKVHQPKKTGEDLLNDPLENRGNAFCYADRERYRLRGLLPPAVFNMQFQTQICYEEFSKGESFYSMQSEKSSTDRINPDDIRKFRFMQSMHNQNETLYYKLLIENIEEISPIIYTPTVGWFCENFSRNFRRPRGLFVTKEDRGRMLELLSNWYVDDVKAIVVTDGSRILGLGDLGVGGMGISIGKTSLYVAAGGFAPSEVMPVVLDVGTNNQKLLQDPMYLGLKSKRLDGPEYYDFIDEFVSTVFHKYPRALLQFEDFEFKHANTLLSRYRDEFLIFNDDIQGTASVVLAGVLGALKIQGRPARYITEQVFVLAGAGNAGRGIISKLHEILMKFGLTDEQAYRRFYLVDAKGLITTASKDLDDFIRPFARPETEFNQLELSEVVKRFRPTCLIGSSARAGLFTPEILTMMGENASDFAPIIFPLSNPTFKAECTAESAYKHTKGRAIFGSGSPFADVVDPLSGRTMKANFTNNAYIYPGLAFGSSLGQFKKITDSMLITAAETLSNMLTPQDIESRRIFPKFKNIRDISAEIATQIIETAHKENLVQNQALLPLLTKTHAEIVNFVKSQQWLPDY